MVGSGGEITVTRLSLLQRLYELLDRQKQVTPFTRLSEITSSAVPESGVYYFFEDGEYRSDSGTGLRVVRVGTHAISATSNTKLWSRLKQHRGNDKVPGGNHRGSIFRLLIGEALQNREAGDSIASWGIGSNASREIRAAEQILEARVSDYLGKMYVIAVSLPQRAQRQLVESGSIALLSNYGKVPIDAPSPSWLGRYSGRQKVRESGLWNSRDVDAAANEAALDVLELAIQAGTH